MQLLINNCCHQAEAIPTFLPPPQNGQFLHSDRSVKVWILGELARKRGICGGRRKVLLSCRKQLQLLLAQVEWPQFEDGEMEKSWLKSFCKISVLLTAAVNSLACKEGGMM